MTDVGDIERSLKSAEALLARASAAALALDELPNIALPPALPEIDAAQLKAVASLYLAAELEAAGVIAAADGLARLARTGTLQFDLGTAAKPLYDFWQSRNERASEDERTGFFGQLFGIPLADSASQQPANTAFEERLLDVCEALYKLDEQGVGRGYGGIAPQQRLRAAGMALVDNIVHVAGGITVFMAQEVLSAMRQALAILNQAPLKAAFDARSIWDVVAGVDHLLKREHAQATEHVRRGQAGMTIIAWLADVARNLEGSSTPLAAVDHPVVSAAADWLEATLALGQPDADPQATTSHPASGWAALAG